MKRFIRLTAKPWLVEAVEQDTPSFGRFGDGIVPFWLEKWGKIGEILYDGNKRVKF